eukprot:PLAT6868.2.p1 GENE.PLAT6868.2~~PLAT6868.2.p1  ORF type:complete len:218 (+),score=41.98 PLAT6868.2:122-775(+)
MQPSPRRSSVSIASTASGGGRGSPQAPAKSSKVAAKAAGATSPEKSMARSALATSWHSRRQRAVTISATDLPRPAAAVLLSAIAVVLALLLVIAPALRASAYVEHSCRVAGVATVAAQCDCGVKSCLPRQPCLQLTMWLLDGRRDGSARLAVMDERALSRPDINWCACAACCACCATQRSCQQYFARLLRRRRRTAPATCSSGSRLQQHYCCAQLLG